MKTIRILFIAVFISMLTNCKTESKNEEVKDKGAIEEVTVKDLDYYLTNGLKDLENNETLGEYLTGNVFIRSFGFYEKAPDTYTFIIELQEGISNEVVKKYTFALEGHIYEKDKDKLTSYSKSKNRMHEAWFFKPELTTVNNNNYVLYDIKTSLKDFEKLSFYVFDRDGYKGVIGKKREFYEYSIE